MEPMCIINTERLAAITQQMRHFDAFNTSEALSEPKFGLVLDEEVTLLKQEPHHDVESVFWVLVCRLVRALPHGADNNPLNAYAV